VKGIDVEWCLSRVISNFGYEMRAVVVVGLDLTIRTFVQDALQRDLKISSENLALPHGLPRAAAVIGAQKRCGFACDLSVRHRLLRVMRLSRRFLSQSESESRLRPIAKLELRRAASGLRDCG